jgi:hypothetical protein
MEAECNLCKKKFKKYGIISGCGPNDRFMKTLTIHDCRDEKCKICNKLCYADDDFEHESKFTCKMLNPILERLEKLEKENKELKRRLDNHDKPN